MERNMQASTTTIARAVAAGLAVALAAPGAAFAAGQDETPAPDATATTSAAETSPAAPAGAETTTPTGDPNATTEPAPATTDNSGLGARSGLTIDLGVFGQDKARTAKFETVVGRKVDVAQVFPARENGWASVMGMWWADAVPEGANVEVAVPLLDGDAEWTQLAEKIKAAGFDHPYVTLGWEFNLQRGWEWIQGSIGNDEYVKRYQVAATRIKAVLPNARIVWAPNTGQGGVAAAMGAYPGDEYVDYFALSAYDWPSEDLLDGPGGLNEWAAEAAKHGKRIGLREWGVHGGKDGGGDNPEFIRQSLAWAERVNAAFLFYFDEPADYITNSLAEGMMPKAGAALKEGLAAFEKGTNPAPTVTPEATATNEAPAPVVGSDGAVNTEPVKNGVGAIENTVRAAPEALPNAASVILTILVYANGEIRITPEAGAQVQTGPAPEPAAAPTADPAPAASVPGDAGDDTTPVDQLPTGGGGSPVEVDAPLDQPAGDSKNNDKEGDEKGGGNDAAPAETGRAWSPAESDGNPFRAS